MPRTGSFVRLFITLSTAKPLNDRTIFFFTKTLQSAQEHVPRTGIVTHTQISQIMPIATGRQATPATQVDSGGRSLLPFSRYLWHGMGLQ